MRAKAADQIGAEGYAAVFDVAAEIGWFHELIKPGAFTRAISEKQDVRCLQNHDSNIILGRTKSGSLTLSQDAKGLKFDCTFPDTNAAKDLHQLLSRGDIDQCSFGFIVREQLWREVKKENGDYDLVREILDLDLMDVSIVTFPAFDATSCEPRSLWPDGVPREIRSKQRERRNNDCECECPECQAGDCLGCSDPECDDPNCEGSRSRKHNLTMVSVASGAGYAKCSCGWKSKVIDDGDVFSPGYNSASALYEEHVAQRRAAANPGPTEHEKRDAAAKAQAILETFMK